MTLLVPRLDRPSADALIDQWVGAEPGLLTAAMPLPAPAVTFSEVGGSRTDEGELRELRLELLALAEGHGMPGAPVDRAGFEATAAAILHGRLTVTPHEASHDEVWNYLTCCWLLDIAIWRFGADADRRRFLGDVNRNTFRRMWWRAEILGTGIDLARLGEDELVAVMERPTIASDRRLARRVFMEFLGRVDRDEVPDRMLLMREAMKRLLRLTPFVALSSLDERAITTLVSDVFAAAAAGLAGEPAILVRRSPEPAPDPSPFVSRIDTVRFDHRPDEEAHQPEPGVLDFETVAEAALDITRRTGRVTSITLREAVPITADEARTVFRALMERGDLARRGVKRGTYYVLHGAPDDGAQAGSTPPLPRPPPKAPEAPPVPTPGRQEVRTGRTATQTALRRLLRRGR